MSDKDQAVQIAKIEEHSKNTDKKLDNILDSLGKILIQTTKHNGRMKKLELWKAGITGGGKVLKSVWGVIGVFVIAMIFGMFNMYTDLQITKLQYAELQSNTLTTEDVVSIISQLELIEVTD